MISIHLVSYLNEMILQQAHIGEKLDLLTTNFFNTQSPRVGGCLVVNIATLFIAAIL